MAATLNMRRLVRNPKALAALGLGLVAFLYLRARAANASVAVSTPVPTGLDATAAGTSSDGTAAAGSLDGSGYITADQLTATLTPVAAALEGFQSGLMDLQTQQAQTAAQAQSAQEAAAQLAQSYNDATSLGGGGLAGVISSLTDVVTSLNTRAISSSPSPTPVITAAAAPLRVAVTAPASTGQAVVPWSSLPASPVPKATQPAAPAEPFGGVASVKKLANGATLTTYESGRQVEQAPGKSAYVVHK